MNVLDIAKVAKAHGVVLCSTYLPEQQVTLVTFSRGPEYVTIPITDFEVLRSSVFDVSALIRLKLLEARKIEGKR